MVQAPLPGTKESLAIGAPLSTYESLDETLHIGTRFFNPETTQLSQFLVAPNADELVKDLATLVAHRGVVFFKDQDLTLDQQRVLGTKLGELSGEFRPKSSTLHRHPISEETGELGADISVISSKGGIARAGLVKGTKASNGWHADITFEHVPSDYAILKMLTVPKIGGDTLWASGYEAYDRLSPAYKRFLEGLTAVHSAPFFVDYAKATGRPVQDPRGSPENTGSDLEAVHPVIRTHPITGYKTLFVNRTFTKRIVELTPDESDSVLAHLFSLIPDNHDLQVRYRWSPNDIAIWDNRCTFHTATNDYDEPRNGNRVVSIGEKPYFDPTSVSRREALNIHVP